MGKEISRRRFVTAASASAASLMIVPRHVLGGSGMQAADAAFWALELGQPTRIEAETTSLFAETAPAASRIVYEFPARGERPPIRCVWRDGGLAPSRPPELAAGERLPGGASGQLFVGDDGAIGADMYGREPRVFPTALHEDVMASPPPKKYPRSAGVYREWIDACKGHGAPGPASRRTPVR